jgi:hypothetical protein
MPNKPIILTSSENPPPGHLISNTLTNPTAERLIIGSDGSLHLQDQVAAAAWIISAGPELFMSATFIMENVSSYTSHRIELERIFCALHNLNFLNMTPTMADQWCNNKQVVKDTTRPIEDPSGMLKAKADIILGIHHLKNRLPFHTRILHVYGHQDTKKIAHIGEQPQEQTYPAQVLINIACNAMHQPHHSMAYTTKEYIHHSHQSSHHPMKDHERCSSSTTSGSHHITKKSSIQQEEQSRWRNTSRLNTIGMNKCSKISIGHQSRQYNSKYPTGRECKHAKSCTVGSQSHPCATTSLALINAQGANVMTKQSTISFNAHTLQ